jgi:hypothetical protein
VVLAIALVGAVAILLLPRENKEETAP